MHHVNSSLENMLAGQMRPNGVTDPAILHAFSVVKRECFVPDTMKAVAYADENLPLPDGRVMMKPFLLARLMQLAAITPEQRVLHIAAGTGYGSAILSQLAGHVMAIESHHELAEAARSNLRECSFAVEIFISSLTVGYPLASPYDLIFIEGAVQYIPASLVEQLKEEGRIIAVQSIQRRMDAASGLGKALLAQKINGKLHQSLRFDASVSLLPGFEKKEEFVF